MTPHPSAAGQAFAGFSPEIFEFFQQLEANNDRAWFAAHKSVYERAVKWPAQAYSEEVADALAEQLGGPVRTHIFRIHRDVRFSKDKRPYNAHLHISFHAAASEGPARTGYYMGLEPRRMVLGAGAFDLPGPLLVAYREAVADPRTGEPLQALVDGLVQAGWRLHPPALKRTPSGFAPDHPRAELLKHKSLVLFRDVDDLTVATGPRVVTETLDGFQRCEPLNGWLAELRARA